MPRTAPFNDKLTKIICGFPDFKVEGSMIFCIVCEKYIRVWHKSQCSKHMISKIHQTNKLRGIPKSQFIFDLCVMLCTCNLASQLLDYPHFRSFWKKYVPQWDMPSSSYIRHKSIPKVYDTVINNIKSAVKNQYVYVTINETTDRQVTKIVHVLVRCLRSNQVSPPYLILSKRVSTPASGTIVQIVDSALTKIGINAEKVLLFVTGTDLYMKNAGEELKKKYTRMIHITCLVHSLHCVAEEIRKQYYEVDKFIFTMKNMFFQSLYRRRAFCNTLLLPLPPAPDLTRCGTWLRCVTYYADHFDEIKKFVLTLNPSDSEAIAVTHRYFQNSKIISEIQSISKQFRFLLDALVKLENKHLSLKDSLAVIDGVKDTFAMYSDTASIAVKKKLQCILKSNPGYMTMFRIQSELTSSDSNSDLRNLYSYGPLTSVDVEQSFLVYKTVVRPNRMRLSEKSVECILVIMQYYNTLQQSCIESR